MNGHDIRRGVSLYSYQEDYFLNRIDLKGAIAASAETGAVGIETIAEQMMPGFPHLTDAFYADYARMMAEYGTISVAHDMFLDTKRYKSRLLTDDEMVESLHRDIEHTARLGASVIRILVITPPHIVERAAPLAISKGIKLCLEVHSPWHFEHPWVQEHLAVADRVGREHVGLIPDLGIFVENFPRIISDRSIRDGAHPEIVEYIVGAYDAHRDLTALPAEIEPVGANAADLALADTVTHFVNEDPKKLIEYSPYIHHVHGKFYEMTEDDIEPSIPYPAIVAALKEAGYTGYIASEYEGNRHIQDAFEVRPVEQVQRHQRMLARLIAAD
jgi:sugar phosphate isomerase/epimerase